MTYSEVIKNELYKMLPKKNKYNKSDLKKLINKGFELKKARFIIMSASIYYNIECSQFLYNRPQNKTKRMF